MSDESEKLPGGHTYVNEGRCYKFILINIKGVESIESCVSEYKYDDNFITISQVDESECEKAGLKDAKNKRYYIIEVPQKSVIGSIDRSNFEAEFKKLRIGEELFLNE